MLLVDPVYAARAAELLERCPTVEAVFTFGPADVGEDLGPLLDEASPASVALGHASTRRISRWLLYTGGHDGRAEGGDAARAGRRPDGAVGVDRLGPPERAALPGVRADLPRRRDAGDAGAARGGTSC